MAHGSTKNGFAELEAAFRDHLSRQEIVETESSVYRRVDVIGDGYRVFELISLLPRTGFTVHITKMRR
jgi:hypothetical protein